MAKLPAEMPVGPLPDLLAWWRQARVKGLIIGGLAVALLGRPRTTRDLDAMVFVDEKRWAEFLKLGKQWSFKSRIPKPLEFANEARVFLLLHRATGIEVDLSLANMDLEKEILDRSRKVRLGRLFVPVPTREDLIILKAIANRPKDQVDIQGLLDMGKELDLAHIRTHVERFAELLEQPELYAEIDRVLLRHAKGRD